MKKTMIALTLTSLCAAGSALAEDDMDTMIDELPNAVVYKVNNGKLQAMAGDEVFETFAKGTLPASCQKEKFQPIKEKYKNQPSSDIVGTWQMSLDFDDEGGKEMTESLYLNIAANGQVVSYSTVDKGATCQIFEVGELDGNKQSFEDMGGGENDAELSMVKLTTFDKQLAVVSRFSEKDAKNPKESYQFNEVTVFDKAAQLPSACDIQKVVPKAEASNNNPAAAVVGIWQDKMADDMIMEDGQGDTNKEKGTFSDYFVVTQEGFMARASYENVDGQEKCHVEYIGETVNELFKK